MENGLLEKRLIEHMTVAEEMLYDKDILMKISVASAIISQSLKHGGKVIIFGNGGSAADAQHMAAEFVGQYLKVRKSLPAIALTANTSTLTAIGNDYGYDKVFSRQIEGLANSKDIVIGISTSGNSKNVIDGLKAAKIRGASTIALIGKKKCKMDTTADIVIKVPSENTPRIQEMHILIIHTICEIVENEVD